jgi:hypothetical protein
MFYKNIELPNNTLDRDAFLLLNFLKQTPAVLKKLAEDFFDMNTDFHDKENVNIIEIVEKTFDQLKSAQRDFKIDVILTTKATFEKLEQNGLTGKSLAAKLKVLDWLWEKCKSIIINIRSGLNLDIVQTLLNHIKSILKSLLMALGISSDIYEECVDLLLSFSVMSNVKYQDL